MSIPQPFPGGQPRNTHIARRPFLRQLMRAGLALGFPAVVPGTILGRGDRPSPANRITVGAIGIGGMGRMDLTSLLQQPELQFLAVCDVRESNRQAAGEMVNRRNQNHDCAVITDWRELMARPDLDAIYCATPDHWHAIISVTAALRGKDIYCQKPMSLTIAEGRTIANSVRHSGIVFQSGTQRRSQSNYRFCVETARSGRIGRLRQVQCRMGGSPGPHSPKITAPPRELDYDLWLGPAPLAPYSDTRVSGAFRWITPQRSN